LGTSPAALQRARSETAAEKEQRVKAERELTALKSKLFHELGTALPWKSGKHGCLDEGIWTTQGIEDVRSPDEGQSAPVFFVKLGGGGIVVFKCVRKGEASRIFVGDRVVQYFGVKTPNLRFVLPSSTEFTVIVDALQASAAQRQERAKDHEDQTERCLKEVTGMSAKETKYEAIMILQYVKADRVDEFLRDHDETQDSGGTVGTIFRRIGRLVIADLLIDNPDRFTLYGLDSQDRKVSSVWEHDSTNTGNVLVATSGKDQIVALDHDLSKLDAEAYVSTTDLSDVPIGTSGSLFRLRQQDQRNRAIARFMNAFARGGFEEPIGGCAPGKHPTARLVRSLDVNVNEGSEVAGKHFFVGCEPHVRLGMLQGVCLVANFPQL
jgi:hypothetical protein